MRPRVVTHNGETHVEMGWFVKSMIISGAGAAVVAVLGIIWGAFVGYPAMAQDLDDQEERVTELEDSVNTVRRNQGDIDERQRHMQADGKWTQKKLDALMEAQGVTERIERPEIERSTLE